MEGARHRFLIVEDDNRYAEWLRHSVGAGWPLSTVSTLDMQSFSRTRAALTVRDIDLVLASLPFGETPEDSESNGLEWVRKLRSQPGFPDLIVLADGGSELTAVRAIRLGATDYLPKKLLTPLRLQSAIKATLRLAEKARLQRSTNRATARGRPAVAIPAAPAAIAPVAPAATAPVAPLTNILSDAPQIPGYTVLQKLGDSEAAAVYLALSEALGENVALKVSKQRQDSTDPDADAQAVFQREFEAIAALDHSAVVRLFDYGIQNGAEFLAMEYFPCGDLKARLQNPISPEESLDFIRRIAEALQVVHRAEIIHRDLKPPNVMLRDDGTVVLIDFGLARSLLSAESSTRTGVLRGSPYYMSPEQAQGAKLDVRTDLYSLGVILFEMLAGRKPYLGASAIDVLQQHVMAPVPDLPENLRRYQGLLNRLMAKSLDERIGSAAELLTVLEALRNEPPELPDVTHPTGSQVQDSLAQANVN
jgi:ActR/RegA family two-component response regulator